MKNQQITFGTTALFWNGRELDEKLSKQINGNLSPYCAK